MKRFLNFFLLIYVILLGLNSCKTQHNFNAYEISKKQLEKELINQTDSSTHQKLTKRFVNLDTTLTEKELLLLYYGQVLQPDFYNSNPSPLFEIYENIQDKKFQEAELKTDSILAIDPINLSANYLKSYLVSELKPMENSSKKHLFLTNKLFDAILSTGDGLDKKNAIDVVSVSDEYFICYNLLLTGNITNHVFVFYRERVYDKLIIEPTPNFNYTEIWFDVTNFYTQK